jgi:hypothetical protein
MHPGETVVTLIGPTQRDHKTSQKDQLPDHHPDLPKHERRTRPTHVQTAWPLTLRPQARYRVRCASCQREFDRISPTTVMRPHQDSYGNPCPGRRGYRI